MTVKTGSPFFKKNSFELCFVLLFSMPWAACAPGKRIRCLLPVPSGAGLRALPAFYIKRGENVIRKIKQIMCTVLFSVALLAGCGSPETADRTDVLWQFQYDEDIDFHALYDEIEYTGYSYTHPEHLTEINFVAYYAYAGSSSHEEEVFIVNGKEGDFEGYKLISEDGRPETYRANYVDEEKCLALFSRAVPMQDEAKPEGAYTAYGYLYYREGEEILCCRTVNIIENEMRSTQGRTKCGKHERKSLLLWA